MTRPELLVNQLARAATATLIDRRTALQRQSWPAPPLPPEARTLHARYKALVAEANKLKLRLDKLGVEHWGNTPRMRDTGEAKRRALAPIETKLTVVTQLKQAALLNVRGMPADKARPIVLKLQRDLQRLTREK